MNLEKVQIYYTFCEYSQKTIIHKLFYIMYCTRALNKNQTPDISLSHTAQKVRHIKIYNIIF